MLMHGKCKKGTITIIIAIIIYKINKLFIFIITIIIMLAEAIFKKTAILWNTIKIFVLILYML